VALAQRLHDVAMTMMKTKARLLALAAGITLCGAGPVWAVDAAPTISKAGYKSAQQRIEAQRTVDLKACARLKGNAADVCELQAKGKAAVAKAELDAQLKPTPELEQAAKEAGAEADYKVAKEKCDDARDRARDNCLKQAKAQREAAIRMAKVEKVAALRALKAEKTEQRKGKPPENPAARYAAVKARCEMQGQDRDRCLAELKRAFHKS
jgi:hypothetical protein